MKRPPKKIEVAELGTEMLQYLAPCQTIETVVLSFNTEEYQVKKSTDTRQSISKTLYFSENITKTESDIRFPFMKSLHSWNKDFMDTSFILVKTADQILTRKTNLNLTRAKVAAFKKEVHFSRSSDKIKTKSLSAEAILNQVQKLLFVNCNLEIYKLSHYLLSAYKRFDLVY